MDAIELKEQTTVIAKDQPPYFPLPAYMEEDGTMVFCWKLSFKELIKVIWTRKVWHLVKTFNRPLQPQLLMADSPFINKPETQK